MGFFIGREVYPALCSFSQMGEVTGGLDGNFVGQHPFLFYVHEGNFQGLEYFLIEIVANQAKFNGPTFIY